MPHVPGCDGGHCTQNEPRQLRRLPWNNDPDGGGASIVCHDCFGAEMRHRRFLNMGAGSGFSLPLPKWTDLAVYPEE